MLGYWFICRLVKTWGVTGDWSKLHEGELRDFYCSPNNIRMRKSRKMKQAVMGVMWRRSVMHIVSLQSLKKETTWKTLA